MFTNSPMIWNTNYFNEVVFPNPSAESTNIQLQTISNRPISLHIFDLNGRLIRTLLNNETLGVGNYTINWDHKNYEQQVVSAGTYLYVIQNNKQQIANGKICIQK